MGWALITGGSKGIGRSIATALAKRNYNLLLIARDYDVLLTAKNEIENQYHVRVEIMSCNLSLSESPKSILEYCENKGLKINILCNNAGVGGTTDFPDLLPDDIRDMIRMNIESAIVLSSIFIPTLKKQPPAYILNVSSMAGFSSLPLKSIYSATKAALINFSYSMKYILKFDNISVSCLCPGPVFTKSSIEKETVAQMGWVGRRLSVNADKVAEYAVRGMLKQKMIMVPGRMATFLSYILKILPAPLIAYLVYRNKINRLPL